MEGGELPDGKRLVFLIHFYAFLRALAHFPIHIYRHKLAPAAIGLAA